MLKKVAKNKICLLLCSALLPRICRSLLLSAKMLCGGDGDRRCKVGVTEPIRISSGRAADPRHLATVDWRQVAADSETLTGHISRDEPPPASTPSGGGATPSAAGAETFNGIRVNFREKHLQPWQHTVGVRVCVCVSAAALRLLPLLFGQDVLFFASYHELWLSLIYLQNKSDSSKM